MGCKNAWDRDFTQQSVNKSFYDNGYKDRRKDLLFEGEKARFPETMPAVENYKNIKTWEKEKKQEFKRMEKLKQEWAAARENCNFISRKIASAKVGDVGENVKHFVRKCPGDGCEGFLSSAWKCGVCNLWACSKCFAEKGYTKNEEHVCDSDNVASAELIKKETKGCPSCGTRISKINGCDQMWCTACHVAFSWDTGRRVNGVIHNPHFYEFQRDGGTAIQNPGAQNCGGLPTYFQIRDRTKALFGNGIFKKYARDIVSKLEDSPGWHLYKRFTDLPVEMEINYCVQRLHRGASHFQHTVLDTYRARCQHNQDNKQLRLKFICGEITEDDMKTKLIKQDTAFSKNQSLLNVYELMGAIYTESVIDIHAAMSEFVRDVVPTKVKHKKLMNASKVQKVLVRIHKNILNVENVRIYCNIELCKISGIYKQGVTIIDGRFFTCTFNKEVCKKELKKGNAGQLHVLYHKDTRGEWHQLLNNNKPIYV